MAGPNLDITGDLNGYAITCDGEAIARAPTFAEASAKFRELRAVRVFAAEELRHVLAKPAVRRTV